MITFPSVYHAFRAKKLLKGEGIPAELVPVPRELSGSCEGLAAQVSEEHIEQAVEILGNRGVAMVQKGVKVLLDN
ncbi:DUF3343 domain-containing protein [Methylomusa anaerophila]|uniref:DUF3343 domain-containing protein n=1 Tax=Methylomusa anaerophila TaxID=1930071 RepID=UPI002D1FAF42|nr:DUF3343 domain-containing protein [Methylomusa anaerophila]